MVKEILKKMAVGKTEKAFTEWQHYSPKMPKILVEKIEEKKDEK